MKFNKCNLNQLNKISLDPFDVEFKNKVQTEQQRKQASHDVPLFYELGTVNLEEVSLYETKKRDFS